MWTFFNRPSVCLEMTLKQARGASHQGQCDDDVAALMAVPKIARQLRKIDPAELRDELAEYGAWDDEQLADHAANLERIIWIAAGNIIEEQHQRERNRENHRAGRHHGQESAYASECPLCHRATANA